MEKKSISIEHIYENDKCQGTGTLAEYPEGNIDAMEGVVTYRCINVIILNTRAQFVPLVRKC